MITDRIGRHDVLLPINHNFSKICDIIGYFLKSKQKKIRNFVSLAVKKSHLSARVMARTVQMLGMTLMTHPVLLNCPIKAEIRAVDSQSDLTICYSDD